MLPTDPQSPTDGDFERLEERLLHTVDAQLAHRRHRHRAVLAASAVLLVAGGSATAWVTRATPELRTMSAYCYADASTDSVFTQTGSPDAQAGIADPVDAAMAKCAAVWNIDFFTPPSGSAAEAGRRPEGAADDLLLSYPVPDLQACQRPDGVLAVFPVWADNPDADDPDAFCAAVGLQPPYRP
ncbi:hypothetical protein E3T61_02975 [Cryobacterium lactosi]|uniref:Uncharacterized protein n=1 Tax=Cryobacterium lactosi TaxID=1259202 RepID=A0A4V3IXY4_9MICO|nr:hypothetical protein [Cryobacterium lactosi]TFD93984.1 hypothetical protein E3T61_02975 [Cryobacterium lactosi]